MPRKNKITDCKSRAIGEIESIAFSSDESVSLTSKLSALKLLIDISENESARSDADEKLERIIRSIGAMMGNKE